MHHMYFHWLNSSTFDLFVCLWVRQSLFLGSRPAAVVLDMGMMCTSMHCLSFCEQTYEVPAESLLKTVGEGSQTKILCMHCTTQQCFCWKNKMSVQVWEVCNQRFPGDLFE